MQAATRPERRERTERAGRSASPASGRPAWIVSVEAVSVAGFVGLWSAVLLALLESVPLARWLWLAPAAGLAGWVLADLVSGCVHWFADTYFDPRTPVLGPLLIEPFRAHHRDPRDITRHGFLELLGNNALATLPIAGGLLLSGGPGAGTSGQALHAGVLALAIALFATNAFHCWAHLPRPPRAIARLQRLGLVLSAEVHDRHHRGGHDRSYCVTSGRLNPWLDRVGFFLRLESGLARLGLQPADPARRPVSGSSRAAGR